MICFYYSVCGDGMVEKVAELFGCKGWMKEKGSRGERDGGWFGMA
jgi:hypothetical protein